MISDKKFIQDVYTVQKFQNYFQPYVRIIIILTAIAALFTFVVRRTHGLLGEMINPYTRILMIITATTAVVFLPYILFVLYKENRKGWILFLTILVIFPSIFLFMFFKLSMFYNMAVLFPILLYTLFCYLLKSQISEWLSEYYGHQNRMEQKRLKEEEAERLKNELF
jgi:membrane-associated HD superfamily phosphohydrolase